MRGIHERSENGVMRLSPGRSVGRSTANNTGVQNKIRRGWITTERHPDTVLITFNYSAAIHFCALRAFASLPRGSFDLFEIERAPCKEFRMDFN